MRKMIFTLLLAIVSSVWTLSNALCLGPIPDAMYQPYTTVSGTIQALPLPCEPGEECPPCLTEAIVTNDKTYYLTTKNQQVADFLEHIHTSPVPAIYLLPLKATASGTPYQMGSFGYLLISSLNELSVEYFSDQQENKLPSLCDEWNVVLTIHHEEATRYWTYTQKLTTDTIINEHLYAQSYCDNKYIGAFREGENRDIYCVPATTNEEYLVYAWNAQVGDTLYNLLVGGGIMYALGFSDKAVVREIKETVPRTFVVDYEYIYNRKIDSADTTWWEYQWIEGVGMTCGPSGDICPFDFVGDPVKSDILCAYKNGEQIYVSDMGEQYGCVYNYDPYSTPSDTIPLFFYTGDDPGSSTVDPVDPNQVVATLQGDLLTIHEHSGVDVTYSLQHNAPSQMPSPHRAPQSDTFRDMVTLQITESGEYQLLLTNPSWGYSIFGNFIYAPQGIEQISSSSQGGETSRLVLMNGQIYILRGEKIYTLTGQEVR